LGRIQEALEAEGKLDDQAPLVGLVTSPPLPAPEEPKELGVTGDELPTHVPDGEPETEPDETTLAGEPTEPAEPGETQPEAKVKPKPDDLGPIKVVMSQGEEAVDVSRDEVERAVRLARQFGRYQKEVGLKSKQAEDREESVKTVVEGLKADPLGIMTQILEGQHGRGRAREMARKAAEDFLINWLNDEALPPEKRMAKEGARELEEQRAELGRIRGEREAEDSRASVAQWEQKIEAEVRTAVKAAGMKEEPKNLSRVYRAMVDGMDAGLTLTAEDAAYIVQKEDEELLAERFGSASPEEVARKFPELSKKINALKVQEHKDKLQRGPASGKVHTSPLKPKETQVATWAEARRRIWEGA
jgi:hypothetical protein